MKKITPILINNINIDNITNHKLIKLENGLSIIVINDYKKTKITSISIRFETDYTCNLSDVIYKEIIFDMLLAGTKKYNKKKLDNIIDELCMSISGNCNEINVSFINKNLNKCIDVISDIIMYPTISNIKEFNNIINRYIIKYKMLEKDTHDVLNRTIRKLCYGNKHPYGYFIKKEDFNKLTLDKLKKLYEKIYVPNNSYLVINTNISNKIILNVINKYFCKWKRKELKTYKNYDYKYDNEINIINFPFINQVILGIGKIINVKKYSNDYYKLLLSNVILGRSPNSKLFLNLREDKGFTYNINSSLHYKYFINLFIYTEIKYNTLNQTIFEIMKEINLLSNVKINNNELLLKKNEIIGEYITSLDDKKNIISSLYDKYIYNLKNNPYSIIFKKINNINTDDVLNTFKKYITNKGFKIVIVGNKNNIIKEISKFNYSINTNYLNKFNN